jgi:hypothetical protein
MALIYSQGESALIARIFVSLWMIDKMHNFLSALFPINSGGFIRFDA